MAPSPDPSADNANTLSDLADLGYFSTLAPIERDVYWQNRRFRFSFKILDGEQERDVQALVESEEPINDVDRALCEVFARLSLSVVSVNSKSVADEHPTVRDRMAWVASFPSTLTDLLIAEYQSVRVLPISLVAQKSSDPNSSPARELDGDSPSPAEPTMGGN